MKRMRWALVAGLFIMFIVGLMVRFAGQKEPSYQGRSLSFWLKEWSHSGMDRTNQAAMAIRAIGSNGVPILLARLTKDQSTGERKFWRFAGKIIPDDWNPVKRDLAGNVEAADAINLLGGEAKGAFPTLTNLWSNRNSDSLLAAVGLAGMGHEGVVVLLTGLTNQDWEIRSEAAAALGQAGSDLDKVIPALIDVVKIEGHSQEDSLLREAAGRSLVQLHKEPEVVVPVFLELLASPDAATRSLGASILGDFGPDAKAAVSQLLKARDDVNQDVREQAETALKEIDPEAAGKAGLK